MGKVPSFSGLCLTLFLGIAIGAIGVMLLTSSFGSSQAKPKSSEVEPNPKAPSPRMWKDEAAAELLERIAGFERVQVIRWENGCLGGFVKLVDGKTGEPKEFKLVVECPVENCVNSGGYLVMSKRQIEGEGKSEVNAKYDVNVQAVSKWSGKVDGMDSNATVWSQLGKGQISATKDLTGIGSTETFVEIAADSVIKFINPETGDVWFEARLMPNASH